MKDVVSDAPPILLPLFFGDVDSSSLSLSLSCDGNFITELSLQQLCAAECLSLDDYLSMCRSYAQ